jgi:hypothetical protein
MRKLNFFLATVGAAALLLPGVGARADTILDPLHGQCNGCGEVGGNHTPIATAADNADFGFTASSPPQAGQMELIILVPTSISVTGSLAGDTLTELAEPANGGPATSSSLNLSGTFLGTLLPGQFLETFLHGSSIPGASAYGNESPSNPFGDTGGGLAAGPDAVLGQTITGLEVFAINAGNFTIGQGPGVAIGGLADQFSETGLPVGTEIVAFLNQGTNVIGTAPSGQLDVTQLSVAGAPGPEVATGLPGLLATIAFGGLLWWKRRHNNLSLSLMP